MRPFAPLLALALLACPSEEEPTPAPLPRPEPSAVDVVSPERMRDAVDLLADDALGGRIPGSPGHAVAKDWVVEQLTEIGLEPLGTEGYEYRYEHDGSDLRGRWYLDEGGVVQETTATVGYDLVGLLPGSDPTRADEYIVIAAHYDHLGVTEDGDIYNGAFDDAAGVAAALEVARALAVAPPPRSVVFLITDDEESGLRGARAWSTAPTVPEDDIVALLSVDPVGRGLLPDYSPIVLIGGERSAGFEHVLREAAAWSEQPVVFIQRELVRVFHSDQDAFYEATPPVPGAWLVNPGMAFYHQTTDTAETIDYRVLQRTARWTAEAAFALASLEERFAWDGPQEIGTPAMIGAQRLIGGVLDSTELTSDERRTAEGYYWSLQGAIEAEDPDELGDVDAFIGGALFFLLFDLPGAHPGPVPPPFPN